MIKKLFYRFFVFICRLFPLHKNYVLLSNFNGKPYGDNIKYIVEELRKKSNLKFFLIVEKDYGADDVPNYIIQVRLKSAKLAYLLETSKVIISNVRMGFFFKRKEQLYIQTWHGDGAMKKIEKEVENKLDRKYVNNAKKDSERTDIFLSGSRFMTELYYNSCWFSNYVFEKGNPRCDIIVENSDGIKNKVFEKLSIPKEKSICLYAPTFRTEDSNFSICDLNFLEIKKALDTRFGGDFIFLIRVHPNALKSLEGFTFDNDLIRNATNYPDVMELLGSVSVVISDYSSILYDVALKHVPAFRFVPDLKEYDCERGWHFKFDEYPYPYALNSNELSILILNFDDAKYNETLNSFFVRIGSIISDHSASDISDLIIDFLTCHSKKKFFIDKSNILLTYQDLQLS